MMNRRGRVALLFVAAASLATFFALSGSTSWAGTKTKCSTKPLCASFTWQDTASRSPAGSAHYLSEQSIAISYADDSGATSNLTNLNVKITWQDIGVSTTTSAYVPGASDSRCIPDPGGAPRTVVCTGTPKSLRRGDTATTWGPLVFKTATDVVAAGETTAATGTRVTLTATAKEQITGKGGSPNEAVVIIGSSDDGLGLTSYEGQDDRDISIAGGGLTAGPNSSAVFLATKQTGCTRFDQFSTLPVPSGALRGFYEMVERCYGGTNGATCPTGLSCFGQQVVTTANTLSPVNVQITYTGALPGATEDRISVYHVLQDGVTTHLITEPCSGEIYSGQPPDDEIYCRRVRVTHLPGGIVRVEIDAWDSSNGGWGGFG
jgi:hypothetical protein